MTIDWTLDGRPRTGTKLAITVWEATTCGKPTAWADVYSVPASRRTWEDPDKGTGRWCYQLQVEQVRRLAPARGPDSGPLGTTAGRPRGFDPDLERRDLEHRLTWDAPADTELMMMRNGDDPLDCPDAVDPSLAESGWKVGGNRWAFSARAPRECVVFFAVTAWGTLSPGTEAMLVVPAPAVTPTVGAITPDPDYDATFRVDIDLPLDDFYRLGVEVVAGRCPAAPPAEAGWYDGWEVETGTYQIYAADAGANCLLVAAIDNFGQPGPVVARAFVWEPAG